MEKSEAFGPITIFNNIKTIIHYLIYPHVTNIIIWSIILAYFYSDIINYLNLDFYIKNFANYNSAISLTLVNQFITLITIIFSLIFVIWLNTKIFKWTAIKKTKEYKYEQTIKYQESMIRNLSIVLYYAEQNIDNLSRYMNQASTSFCELITGTKKYQFKENKISQVNSSREFHIRQNYYTNNFKSFNKENKAVSKILKNIKKEHLQSVYYDINKKLTYELFELNIYLSAGDIDFSESFISKEKIENYTKFPSHSLSRIIKKFEK
ncbi:hypothetical protein ACE3MZ_04345 [Paenibacillus sp. WLX1005]|uniref:hypothetical protein n=1 Tax=Paenibacillus sp. WLX1005 TaxID=3243766 RepID=UPI003983F45A